MGQRRKRLTCVFVALQGVKRLRLIQGENTDVVVVSTRRDEPSGVFVTGSNHTDAGHKVGVSGHAVHLREASVRAVSEEKHTKMVLSNLQRGISPEELLRSAGSAQSEPTQMNDKANLSAC